MSKLTTHVLDTAHGCPAAGMRCRLYRIDGGGAATLLRALTLNADGRAEGPLLPPEHEAAAGRFRLVFEVAGYFRARGAQLQEPPFLDEVPIDFGLAAGSEHYHVPLLASPWSYSTYRGS